MAALIALMAVCLFAVGVAAGIIGMVAVAIHREERNLTPTSAAPSQVVRAGRWLNGLYVRAPHRAATGDRKKIPIQSAYQAELAHAEPVSWTALPSGVAGAVRIRP